jgi:hypothetical protein
MTYTPHDCFMCAFAHPTFSCDDAGRQRIRCDAQSKIVTERFESESEDGPCPLWQYGPKLTAKMRQSAQEATA